MYNKDIKAFIIAISCAVICAGLFLSYNTITALYKESYVTAMVRGYRLAADQGVLQIEYAVKYGKSIENFYNMDNIIRQVADSVPSINNIKVINAKGETTYSLYEDKDWKEDSGKLVEIARRADASFTSEGGYYYIPEKIDDANGDMVGALVVNLKSDVLDDGPSQFGREYSLQLLIFIAAAAILIIIIAIRLKMGAEGKCLPIMSIVTLAVLSLLIVGSYNVYMLYATSLQLKESTEQISSWVCSIVQLDIDSVIRKGATIDLIYDINGWLERVSSNVPEIKELFLNEESKVSAEISQVYINLRMNQAIQAGMLLTGAAIVLQSLIAMSASLLKLKLSGTQKKDTMIAQ